MSGVPIPGLNQAIECCAMAFETEAYRNQFFFHAWFSLSNDEMKLGLIGADESLDL